MLGNLAIENFEKHYQSLLIHPFLYWGSVVLVFFFSWIWWKVAISKIFWICGFELTTCLLFPLCEDSFYSHLCMLNFIRPKFVSVMYVVLSLRQSIRTLIVNAFLLSFSGIIAFQIFGASEFISCFIYSFAGFFWYIALA